MAKVVNKKTIAKKDLTKREEFEKYLQKIEDPNYKGSNTSWSLPANASPVEKVKYELCEKILIYKRDNDLSDEDIADKIKITVGEVRDILYYHLDYFTLDRLISYASELFSTNEIKVIIEPKKTSKENLSKFLNNNEWKFSPNY